MCARKQAMPPACGSDAAQPACGLINTLASNSFTV
jgi:hypothetical protein